MSYDPSYAEPTNASGSGLSGSGDGACRGDIPPDADDGYLYLYLLIIAVRREPGGESIRLYKVGVTKEPKGRLDNVLRYIPGEPHPVLHGIDPRKVSVWIRMPSAQAKATENLIKMLGRELRRPVERCVSGYTEFFHASIVDLFYRFAFVAVPTAAVLRGHIQPDGSGYRPGMLQTRLLLALASVVHSEKRADGPLSGAIGRAQFCQEFAFDDGHLGYQDYLLRQISRNWFVRLRSDDGIFDYSAQCTVRAELVGDAIRVTLAGEGAGWLLQQSHLVNQYCRQKNWDGIGRAACLLGWLLYSKQQGVDEGNVMVTRQFLVSEVETQLATNESDTGHPDVPQPRGREYKYFKRDFLIPAVLGLELLVRARVYLVQVFSGKTVTGLHFVIARADRRGVVRNRPSLDNVLSHLRESGLRPCDLDDHRAAHAEKQLVRAVKKASRKKAQCPAQAR